MKDIFLKDSVLKVISFVIALLLWFYIIAVIDPSVDVTVKDIPIRYTNVNVIEEKGLCLISDSKATVELKIRGSRKRIANIDNKNIYATVDLATIGKTGTFSLPIAISIPYEYSEIVSKNPYNANVFIDKVITAEREVEVLTADSVANGYIAGEAETSIKTVTLKGASTEIERIDSVGVQLNYDGRSADISDNEKPFFIDKNGRRISADDEIYNLVAMDIENINVSCKVYKLKAVSVEVVAKASSGVQNYKISVQPSNVTVYAENEILDQLESLKTEIVNLDEISGNTVTTKLVLPEGVSLRDGITEVTVKADKRG